MRRALLITLLLSALPIASWGQALPGQAAPAWSMPDLQGKSRSLAELRGKYVVLEWTNPSCPFVRKHYDSGNMQALQKQLAGADVVWVTVNSTAANHPEYVPATEFASWLVQQKAAPSFALLDPEGRLGKAYGARTTPHMFVVDPKGQVIYAGAIDDKRSTDPADVKQANNYVVRVLQEARQAKLVSTVATQPYGCSVKYAN